MIRSFALLTAAILVPPAASADVIHVFPDGSGDAPTIAAAYELATGNDEISVAPGIYHEHDIEMKSGVDLYGASGNPEDTIVDAQALGRCLYGPDLGNGQEVRSITFRNGTHPVEGGILLAGEGFAADHGTTYRNCIFENGSSPRGGAISINATFGHSPDFIDCRFLGNEAQSDGGAIWCWEAVSIDGGIFSGNSAGRHGGAFHLENEREYLGYYWFEDVVFEWNEAQSDGGAICDLGTKEEITGSEIIRCRFENNTAHRGGALRAGSTGAGIQETYLTIQDSMFLENTAGEEGGAIVVLARIRTAKDADFSSHNVFVRNTAGARGGAISNHEIIGGGNYTFVANGAQEGGHYWIAGGASAVASRSILAFALGGGSAAGPGSGNLLCSDVFGNAGGDFVGPFEGEQLEDNFSLDPLFCGWPLDDVTLSESSPCGPSGPCALIGALDVGCGPVSVAPESWAGIKARYR